MPLIVDVLLLNIKVSETETSNDLILICTEISFVEAEMAFYFPVVMWWPSHHNQTTPD